MNTPNKLTTVRIILGPIFTAILLISAIPHRFLISLVVFIIASITDYLDGKLARKNNQITTYGKFLDPIADKILVLSALLAFVELGLSTAWIPLIVIAREFIVTSVRIMALSGGKVIAANIWGKVKTVSQMIAIIAILILKEAQYIVLNYDIGEINNWCLWNDSTISLISNILLWISVVFTAWSGIVYIWQNREFVNTTK